MNVKRCLCTKLATGFLILNTFCPVHKRADLDPQPLSGYEYQMHQRAPAVNLSGTSAGTFLQSFPDATAMDTILRIYQQKK